MNTAQIAERAYVIQAATDGTADEDIREIVIAAVYDDARDDPEMAKMSAADLVRDVIQRWHYWRERCERAEAK